MGLLWKKALHESRSGTLRAMYFEDKVNICPSDCAIFEVCEHMCLSLLSYFTLIQKVFQSHTSLEFGNVERQRVLFLLLLCFLYQEYKTCFGIQWLNQCICCSHYNVKHITVNVNLSSYIMICLKHEASLKTASNVREMAGLAPIYDINGRYTNTNDTKYHGRPFEIEDWRLWYCWSGRHLVCVVA